MSAPVFVATFKDNIVTRMSVYAKDETEPDLERGKKLARHAYRSRTGKEPPAFAKAHFERAEDGAVLASYSAIDLNDDDDGDEPPPPSPW